MDRDNQNKGSRILVLYTKLLRDEVINKKELAEQFGINEKSIQRDLEIIRDFLDREWADTGFGSQLIYDHQKKGYRLERNEQVHFTNAEILAVSEILLESRAFSRKEMMSILDRLVESCVPEENRKFINKLLSNEKYHYVELRHQKVYLDKLPIIGRAIQESRVIHIRYCKLKEGATVERELEPLAILFSEFYFYLVAFIRGIDKVAEFENADDPFPTIYRIDRIEELTISDEHFKIPYKDRFEEGEFRKRIQFMHGGRLRKVRFKYSGQSVEAVLDRLPTARVLDEEDGAFLIEAEVFGKGVDMWVRSQGDCVTDYTIL